MNEFSSFVKRHDLKITDGYSICQNNWEAAALLPLLLHPQQSAEICYLPYWGRRLLLIAWRGWLHLSLPAPSPQPVKSLSWSQCTSAELCRAEALSTPLSPPTQYQNLCLPLSQLPSLSFMVLLRNTLLLQSFSTRSVWQSVGVKPGLYQSTVLKSYLIKCYGNDFFFQRCGRFAIFPKHTYDLHEKQYYRKGIVLYLSILWAKTESQAMGDAWEACIMSPHEPMVSKKDGEINQFKSYIYLYWTYNHNTLKHVCVAYINIVAGTWEMLRLCCLFLVPDRKLVVCWSK